MPYIPSQHTTVSKPIGISGNSTDARSRYYDASLFRYRDYVSISEVIAYLATAANRRGGFPIFINSTGTLDNGNITGGSREVWWFKDGDADGNLVKMELGVSDYNDLENLPTLFSGEYDDLTGKPNQDLNTTDSVVFNGIEINGTTQTLFFKNASGDGSALQVKTYAPGGENGQATEVLNLVTVNVNGKTRNYAFTGITYGSAYSGGNTTVGIILPEEAGQLAIVSKTVPYENATSDVNLNERTLSFEAPVGSSESSYLRFDYLNFNDPGNISSVLKAGNLEFFNADTFIRIVPTTPTGSTGKTITLPFETGTIALRTQGADIEITDATKGIILRAPTGERVRMTMTVVSGVPTPVYTIL